MNIVLNDIELSILLIVILTCIALFGSIQVYYYFIFKERRINYKFYEARDALIRCLAVKAIKKDDILFKTFYNASNDLINVTNTDFFSLRNFYKVVKKYDTEEQRKFGDKFIAEIRKRPQQFQDAIDILFEAINNTLIKKNILLKLLVDFNFFYLLVKKVLVAEIKNRKSIIEQKNYYEEYKKIQSLRQQITPQVA